MCFSSSSSSSSSSSYENLLDGFVLLVTTGHLALTIYLIVMANFEGTFWSYSYVAISLGMYLLIQTVMATTTQSKHIDAMINNESRRARANEEEIKNDPCYFPGFISWLLSNKIFRIIVLILVNLVISPILPVLDYFLCRVSKEWRKTVGEVTASEKWEKIFDSARIQIEVEKKDKNNNQNHDDDDDEDDEKKGENVVAATAVSTDDNHDDDSKSVPASSSSSSSFVSPVGDATKTFIENPIFALTGRFVNAFPKRNRTYFRSFVISQTMWMTIVILINFLIVFCIRDVSSSDKLKNQSPHEIFYLLLCVITIITVATLQLSSTLTLSSFVAKTIFLLHDSFKMLFIILCLFEIKWAPKEIALFESVPINALVWMWIWFKLAAIAMFVLALPVAAYKDVRTFANSSCTQRLCRGVFVVLYGLILAGLFVAAMEFACFSMLLALLPHANFSGAPAKYANLLHEFLWSSNPDLKIRDTIDWEATFENVIQFSENITHLKEMIKKLEGDNSNTKNSTTTATNNNNNNNNNVVVDDLDLNVNSGTATEIAEAREKMLEERIADAKKQLDASSPYRRWIRFHTPCDFSSAETKLKKKKRQSSTNEKSNCPDDDDEPNERSIIISAPDDEEEDVTMMKMKAQRTGCDSFYRRLRHIILFSRLVRFTSSHFLMEDSLATLGNSKKKTDFIKNFVKRNRELINCKGDEISSLPLKRFFWPVYNCDLDERDGGGSTNEAEEQEPSICSKLCTSFGELAAAQFLSFVLSIPGIPNAIFSLFFPLLYLIMYSDVFTSTMVAFWAGWALMLVLSLWYVPDFIKANISGFVSTNTAIITTEMNTNLFTFIDSYFTVAPSVIPNLVLFSTSSELMAINYNYHPHHHQKNTNQETDDEIEIISKIPLHAFSKHVLPYLDSRMLKMYGLNPGEFNKLQNQIF